MPTIKPILLDGSTGTLLQKEGPDPVLLNLTKPEAVKNAARQYIEAGSQIILANTFGANPFKHENFEELIRTAIALAKEAAAGTNVKVALDIGPLGQLLEPLGSLQPAEAREIFSRIAKAGKDADLIVIETMTDLMEAKLALEAAKETGLPVLVSMSFEPDGRTFTGTTPAVFAQVMEAAGADIIGTNCGCGPDKLTGIARELRANTTRPLSIKPNLGLPDPITGTYTMTNEAFCAALSALPADYAGGCCGTTPDTIRMLARQPFSSAPRPKKKPALTSNGKLVTTEKSLVIGERINPTGKKDLQEALKTKDMRLVCRMALEQEAAGADLLDINVGMAGINETELLPMAVQAVQSVCDLPLVLDSSDPAALEAALKVTRGKPLVNSVSAEPGKLETILPLVKKYGAAVIGLTIDEAGLPRTKEKRLEIANRIIDAARSYGIPKEDVWIDCLCLTVSSMPEQAKETLEAVRELSRTGIPTVLGISNISHGLPNRSLVNATYLAQALEAGLSAAILNPEDKRMMETVLASRLLLGMDPQASAYVQSQTDRKMPEPENHRTYTLEQCIRQGLDAQARQLAKEQLQTMDGLKLVETLLIPTLNQVGEDYEKKVIFLPQLLAAARAAQAVFQEIKKVQKGHALSKGEILLATVQGDLHDIGKNIVATVLENYGYQIVDLGKDVSPDKIVQTVQERNIRLVGLSALMTTTLPAMEETVRQLRSLASPPEIMVGGAVVSPEYAQAIGARYGADAMADVAIAQEVFG